MNELKDDVSSDRLIVYGGRFSWIGVGYTGIIAQMVIIIILIRTRRHSLGMDFRLFHNNEIMSVREII